MGSTSLSWMVTSTCMPTSSAVVAMVTVSSSWEGTSCRKLYNHIETIPMKEEHSYFVFIKVFNVFLPERSQQWEWSVHPRVDTVNG